MDDEQILELRMWAQRLATDDRAELRAAGKAIVMLADELSALRAQQRIESETPAPTHSPAPTATAPDPTSPDVASSLRTRLRSFVGVREPEDGSESAKKPAGPGQLHG